MKQNVLLSLISEDFTLIRKGNYYTTDEHDSLIVDPRKNIFYWNSKGIYGDEISYLMRVRGMNYYEAIGYLTNMPEDKLHKFEVYEIRPQKPNIALIQVFYKYGLDYTTYWETERGYKFSTIHKYKLGYTGKYWVIPLFDGGEFKNFQCRGYDSLGNKIVRNYYSGIGRIRFNFDLLPNDKTTPIFITEAIVDAIMLDQNNLFAISHNSGSSGWDHDWSLELMEYENLYICYDNDEAGLKGAIRTSKNLKHNSKILMWPDYFEEGYDMTDFFKENKRIELLMPYFYPSHLWK